MNAVVIGHEDKGNVGLCTDATNHRKDAAQRRAASKRAFGGLLNDRPIGDRIGKWHAQLNDIGPGLFQPQDELLGFRQAWIARHEICNERLLLPSPE